MTQQIMKDSSGDTVDWQLGWGFVLQWIVASIAAIVMSIVMAGIGYLSRATDPSDNELVQLAIVGIIIGSSVGAAEWLVLRGCINHAGRWVLANVIGHTLSFTLLGALVGTPLIDAGTAELNLDAATVSIVWIGLLASVPIAVLQWLVLRRQISKAILWIPARILGTVGSLSIWLVSIWNLPKQQEVNGILVADGVTIVVGILIMGVTFGTLTGLSLIWLLRRPLR